MHGSADNKASCGYFNCGKFAWYHWGDFKPFTRGVWARAHVLVCQSSKEHFERLL